MKVKKSLTYQASGVSIRQANAFVDQIGDLASTTHQASVIKRKGAFGALFSLNLKGYKKPVLVSSTDGVGTKLLLANYFNRHDTVGIDMVAMNVNDILCVGAKPLFFLDYIACGKLDPKILTEVMRGIVKGCELSGCSLIGGETAEMPGMYKPKDYDLAGFAVGIVEEKEIIDGSKIKMGDKIIGLASSGLHSNGFSLVRKVLNKTQRLKYKEELLTPTRIYVKEILDLIKKINIKGIAHITGGAYYEKLTKILPDGLCFELNKSWPVPEIFKIIQESGNITDQEMYTTFNMGIGLAIVIDKKDVSFARKFLDKKNIPNYEIGEVGKDSTTRIKL